MARAERLGHKPRAYVLERLIGDLSNCLETNEGEPTRVVLVTYNRVGEGLLEPRTVKGNLTLDIYTGLSMTTITPEQMFLFAGAPNLPLLTPEQTADFYYRYVRDELLARIVGLDKPTYFFIYGGEGEKFKLAANLVSRLASLAAMAGKGRLAKFYLATCNCGLGEKVKMTEDLYDRGLLQTLVYNPKGHCGGLTDLQTIAETALKAIPD